MARSFSGFVPQNEEFKQLWRALEARIVCVPSFEPSEPAQPEPEESDEELLRKIIPLLEQ